MKPAWPNESWPTVIGRNMERPMIMLMPIVTRSASPRVNTPVTTPRMDSSTVRITAPLLAPRFDLEAAAEQPGRLVEEDQDEDAEREAVLPRGNQVRHAH